MTSLDKPHPELSSEHYFIYELDTYSEEGFGRFL